MEVYGRTRSARPHDFGNCRMCYPKIETRKYKDGVNHG